MLGDISMAGNCISHSGEPEQDNDAVRLRFANKYFLRRDGSNWMRGDLSFGGHEGSGMADGQSEQDEINLGMIQEPEMLVSEQVTNAANAAGNEAIHNHGIVLDQEIRSKTLNMSSDGSTRHLNTNFHKIKNLETGEDNRDAVNLETMNRKILREIEVDNLYLKNIFDLTVKTK